MNIYIHYLRGRLYGNDILLVEKLEDKYQMFNWVK